MSHREVNLTELRQRAEQAIAQSQARATNAPASPSTGTDSLVEELRIYQVELELQNDELRHAQQQLTENLEKYRILFDNLPLPGIVVDSGGFIVETSPFKVLQNILYNITIFG